MKRKTKNEIIALAVFLILFALFLSVATNILTPKRTNYGSTWGQFLKEEEKSIDVMFFGSSITYCDVIPSVIWDEIGTTSYVMAGPEQTIPFSYYYVKEALKTQSPKLVCLEVTGMFFEKYQDFTQVNAGFMPFGANRLEATFKASEKEQRTGLLFPLYSYHSRWSSLEGQDISIGLRGYPADDLAGYTFISEETPMEKITERGEKLDEENYKTNLEYLRKIAEYCEGRGTKVLFYIAPTCWKLSDEHSAMLEADIADINAASFYDFNDLGLADYDMSIDFYDNLHFNYRGAQKFSKTFANLLASDYGISPSENPDTELWSYRSYAFRKLSGETN